MNHAFVIAAIVTSTALAACGAPADYTGLEGDNAAIFEQPTSKPVLPPMTASSNQPTPLPVPTTGPGSNQSSARQFFIDKVYPALNTTCASCHTSGVGGAPVFLQNNGATAYQTMDGRGMIQPQSTLLTRGQHLGPALDTNQRGLVQQWLDLEAKERVGQAAPVNILEKVGECLDPALFNAIKFEELRTKPRDGENADQCTGCKNTQCNGCHTAGDGNFYMGVGSGLDQGTFAATKKAKYIVKYIGLNGTTPVPSNAIKLKSDSTVTDTTMYLHPMYTMTPEMQLALNNFVQNALYKYLAGQCGK